MELQNNNLKVTLINSNRLIIISDKNYKNI